MAKPPKPLAIPPLERIIPDADMELLQRGYGDETLPEGLIRDYWHYRSIRDRCESSVRMPCEIYLLIFHYRVRLGLPPHDDPGKPFPILQLAKAGEIKPGAFLRVWWRDAERRAQFKEAMPNTKRVHVLLLEEQTEKKLEADLVLGFWKSKPEEETLPSVEQRTKQLTGAV